MKELTKRILQAGLVDKHLAMALERWGTLDRGASETVGTCPVTKETFQKFADDIAVLLDPDEPMRETLLDLKIEGQPIECRFADTEKVIPAILDVMGNLIVLKEVKIGTILIDDTNDTGYEVGMVDPIYVNEEIKAFRLNVTG